MTLEVVSRPIEQPFTTGGDSGQVDVSLRKLKMANALKSAGLNVDVTAIVTDAAGGQNQTVDSTTAPPELQITIFDRGWHVLDSGVFDGTVDVTLDGVPYRLVEVDILAVEMLQLTFYHKIVALLMAQNGALVAARSSVTRAQFIEIMLREIVPLFPGLIYVCPEVNQAQPVASQKSSGRALTTKTLDNSKSVTSQSTTGAGFGAATMTIRDWDGSQVSLDASQLHNASEVLATASQLHAPAKAILAVMEACLVEPTHPYENSSGGTGSSVGILQVTAGAASAVPGGDRLNVVASVEGFLNTGFTGQGGAIALARAHPEWSAGQVAQAVQGSGFGQRYDLAQAGASKLINAYQGGVFAAAGASGLKSLVAGTKTYNFTRGQSGNTEDSWTCAQRLAGEVNWRFFITGRRTVWFVSDDDLIQLPTVYEFTEQNVGLGQITGTVELGGRTIVSHGKRVPKPSEGQVAARVSRWQAQAGSPIAINGYGPYAGAWIITETDRDLFDKAATITFQSPQKPLREPAATSSGAAGSGSGGSIVDLSKSGNPIDRLYAACQYIDSKNLPYVWGGGHSSWKQDATASGLDCSGAVSYALYLAGLMNGVSGPLVSGGFSTWGAAGTGSQMTVWYSSIHVFIEFYGRPAKRFDTVPGGSGGNGPHMRYTAPSDPVDAWENTGFQARHVPGF